MIDIAELRREVQARYSRATEDDRRRHPTRKAPDFRDHDGIRLQKLVYHFTAQEVEDRPLSDLAEECVRHVVDFEHGLIEGAGGDGFVARCFLEGHELPEVFPMVPPHFKSARDEFKGMVKLRHIFGILTLAPEAPAPQAPRGWERRVSAST